MKIINIYNNTLIVQRGFNNTKIVSHPVSSIVYLFYNYKLISADHKHNKLNIKESELFDTVKIGNKQKILNTNEKETLSVEGSIGINGGIIIKPNIVNQPPEGQAVIWVSDGTDDSFTNLDKYQDNNGLLDQGIYIAYKPPNKQTIINRIMKFSDDDAKWNTSKLYKNYNLDETNTIKFNFLNNSNGMPSILVGNEQRPFESNQFGIIVQEIKPIPPNNLFLENNFVEGLHWISKKALFKNY